MRGITWLTPRGSATRPTSLREPPARPRMRPPSLSPTSARSPSANPRLEACDKRFQYLLFAADPYEIIAFKVPSTEIDKSTPKFFSHWDPDLKMFTVRLTV
ncbi:hypothetical protein MUK42_24004 [Musa troglodytarum]|uniref:SF3A2 domain-containing protein n=1 Tax=Musa troglodytarum TaxID=320322 RepID=A0A9E7G831_9LILI|nr:hypothetical protein MUK42_24004 [Musa troglodytarum]